MTTPRPPQGADEMMTLEQVRDALKGVWVPTHWGTDGRSYKMSDLIESLDHYLSQPQPVAQGEAVAEVRHFNYSGIARNGLSQEAVLLDNAPAMSDGTKLYATPTIPTGHRVVPVEPTVAMNSKGAESLHASEVGGVSFDSSAAFAYKAMLAAAPDAGGV